jgi:hypothetical protein
MSKDVADVADVVVVGAGIAGAAAAFEAAAAGARVLVIESEATAGGASAMSGAACCIVDTPLQRALGIKDSVDLALADWSAMGGPTADLEWAQRYLTDSCRDVYEFCAELGIEWIDVGQPEGNSVPRWHVPRTWGRGIFETVLARAVELGVEVRRGSEVTALINDEAGVHGVRVTADEHSYDVSAGAVVLCAGGFAGDHQTVLDAAPELAGLPRLLSGSAATANGRGFRLLEAVGAQFHNLDHIWVYPNGTPDPADPAGQRGLGVRGMSGDIWLNLDGNRFHDESLRGGHSGTRALLAQPGKTAWSVFTEAEMPNVLLIDNEYWATPAGPKPTAMAEFWQRSAYVRRGDTPAELAAAMGLPVPAVEQAVGAVNAALDAGEPVEPQFGRPLAGMSRLDGPGLVAIQFFPMAQKNFGGVRTDPGCRVLDRHGRQISGLLAAGEVAGMAGGGINGRSALEGTMFGPCLYSGRIAGRRAAAIASRPGQ